MLNPDVSGADSSLFYASFPNHCVITLHLNTRQTIVHAHDFLKEQLNKCSWKTFEYKSDNRLPDCGCTTPNVCNFLNHFTMTV